MNNQNYILQAIEMMNHFDISDEHLADAIQGQAELLSGYDSDLTRSDYDFY
jgi:hypothetical protein